MAKTTDDKRVDAALAAFARLDSAGSRAARAAFDSVTAGEGLSALTAHGLADFLWYQLPLKWLVDLDERLFTTRALGELFRRLDQPRYQAMCTSPDTERILTTYEYQGRAAGLKAYRAALDATGLRPADIPGLIEWGSVMGLDESSAYWSASRALEGAIDAGQLRPGSAGWRKTANRITAEFLDSSHDDLTGTTWLQWMNAERLEHWADSRGLTRSRLANSIMDRLTSALPVPSDAAEHVAPVQWLLDHAAGGAPLTQAGYLASAIVVEGCDRFNWLTFGRRPRSESDVLELVALRELVQQMKAVRRSKRELVLSSAGKVLQSAGTARLWEATMSCLAGPGHAEAAAAEIALMVLIEGKPVSYEQLTATVAEALGEEGWRSERTGDMTADHAARLVSNLRWRLDVLRLVANQELLGEPLMLTSTGQVAAHTALRARGLAARHDIYA
jgi:hypothetical protein